MSLWFYHRCPKYSMVSDTCNRRASGRSVAAQGRAPVAINEHVCVMPVFHRVFLSLHRITAIRWHASASQHPVIDEFCCGHGTIFIINSLRESNGNLTSGNADDAVATT